MNFDMEKMQRLMANLADAKAAEKVEASALVEASDALKVQQEVWKKANEALNIHQKELDDFVREQTKVAQTDPSA